MYVAEHFLAIAYAAFCFDRVYYGILNCILLLKDGANRGILANRYEKVLRFQIWKHFISELLVSVETFLKKVL